MKLIARNDGTLAQVRIGDGALYDPYPADGTQELEIDHETNPAVMAGVAATPKAYTISGGTLLHNGQPVTINASGREYTDRKQATAAWQTLETYLGNSSPTAAQSAAALKLVIRLLWLMWRLWAKEH